MAPTNTSLLAPFTYLHFNKNKQHQKLLQHGEGKGELGRRTGWNFLWVNLHCMCPWASGLRFFVRSGVLFPLQILSSDSQTEYSGTYALKKSWTQWRMRAVIIGGGGGGGGGEGPGAESMMYICRFL